MSTVVGAALVLTGCALFGIFAIKNLNDRIRVLWRLISALDYMEAEIRHGLTPLPEILNKLFGGDNEITPEISLNDRWQSAIEALPFKKDERQSLEELGAFLGRFGQEAAIERTREQLQNAFALAKEEQRSKSKLYGFMGIGLGVLIVILVV